MQHLHYQRLIHQNFVQSFPEEKWLNNLHHFTINFSFKLQVHTLEGLMHLPKNPKLEGLLVRCYAPVVPVMKNRVLGQKVGVPCHRRTITQGLTLRRKCCLCNYTRKWLDFRVLQFLQLSILWDVKEPTHLSKRVGHEVSGVVAVLFSKVAGSKYTCKRLRVYEACKICEQPLVKRWFSSAEMHWIKVAFSRR